MFNRRFASRHDEELVVNITSLIDVIFILLIFFMVSTQIKPLRLIRCKTHLPRSMHKTRNLRFRWNASVPLTLSI